MNAELLVKTILEDGPDDDLDIKDEIMAVINPDTYRAGLMNALDDEDSEYYYVYDSEPTERFVADMVRQDKTPREAAELWAEWDPLVEEHGGWIDQRGDEFNYDVFDFQRDWDDNHRGAFNDAAAFGEDWHENCGDGKIPEDMQRFIDWEKYGEWLLTDCVTYTDDDGMMRVFWNV